MSKIYEWIKSGSTAVPNVLLTHYKELGISSDGFVLIVYLLSHIQTEDHDIMEQIATDLGWDISYVMEQLNQLEMRQYLTIELITNSEGKKIDHVTLRPLFEQLDQKFAQKSSVSAKTVTTDSNENIRIVSVFEREFGRVLTPLELETINQWIMLDSYPLDLILLALKEAVIHQALSLKYIDKILLAWDKKNIRTLHEAQQELRRFNDKKDTINVSNNEQSVEIPIVEWQ